MKEISSALIIVDLQNDFMPEGALPVRNGHEVIAVANRLMPHFELVVASMDWHPANHGSFASQYSQKKPGDHVVLAGIDQILWPNHCVQNSEGAKLVEALNVHYIKSIFHKGTDPSIDSYSTFFDNAHRKETGLHHFLTHRGIKDVYLLGLATDYCVKFSALDAINLGYNTFVIMDGCRGVELTVGDSQKAFEEMKNAGAHLIESTNVAARLL